MRCGARWKSCTQRGLMIRAETTDRAAPAKGGSKLGLYVALLACSSPETLARPPVTATIDARTLTVPPPPAIPPRVWSARLFTYGGYTSGGKGMIAMRSDGKVEAIWHCNAQLSEGKRASEPRRSRVASSLLRRVRRRSPLPRRAREGDRSDCSSDEDAHAGFSFN